MITYARACQYKNSQRGMILFRGGKTYESEVSTLLRGDAGKQSVLDERNNNMGTLLLAIHHLRSHYESNPRLEGARMLSRVDSIVSTVRALALMQHYSNVTNDAGTAHLATPMLDTTKDLRVAASFAFQGNGPSGNRHRAVRFLLVGHPGPVEDLTQARRKVVPNPMPADFWEKQNSDRRWKDAAPRWLIQRLGQSRILLVELQALLPASALRPQNQAGYLLVHEFDLFHLHELCQRMNATDQPDVQELLELDETKHIMGKGASGWDALGYAHVNLMIPNKVTAAQFFHDEAFPMFETRHLYPDLKDPMRKIIKQCITAASTVTNSSPYHPAAAKQEAEESAVALSR
jgi:hypothetical protein